MTDTDGRPQSSFTDARWRLAKRWPANATVIAALLAALIGGCSSVGNVRIADPWDGAYPLLQLADESTALLLMQPDEIRGFNRASRFDRAGMVVAARTADGRSYFGPFVPPDDHDPDVDDHVAGTAGEFGMKSPIGYDEANPGETFIKIGVGVLRRTDDRDYFFRRNYPIVDSGRWQVDRGEHGVSMRQSIDDHRGWAYVYVTTVSLLDEERGFAVQRKLTNTGKRPIATDYYCHNFFMLDGAPVSSGYVVTLSDEHAVTGDRTAPSWIAFDGRTMRFERPPKPNKSLYLPLEARGRPKDQWQCTVANPARDIAITVDQDLAPDRVVIYGLQPYLSVEPFIDIRIAPGESLTWTARYRLKE